MVGASLAAGGYAAGRWHEAGKHSKESPQAGFSQDVVIYSKDHRVPTGKTPGAESPAEPAKNFARLVAAMVRDGKQDSDGLLAGWAEQDWEAALAAFLAEPKLQNAENASRLFSRIARKDPARAMALLDELPRKPWNADAVQAIAAAWGGQDPHAAMAAGLALPPGARRRSFLSSASTAWMKKDIIAAAAWLKGLPPEESRTGIIGREPPFLGGGMKSPQEMTALMDIHSMMPGAEHTWLWHDFAHWSSTHPEDALTWAIALPENALNRCQIMDEALGEVAGDPGKALALLPSLTTAKDRNILLGKLALDWGARDPETAWQWAAALSDPKEKASAFDAISGSWAGKDPGAAVAFLEQAYPDKISGWGGAAARSWGEAAPDEAMSWLSQVPEAVRPQLTTEALMGMTQSEPGKALDHASLIAENDSRQRLLREATTELARQDVTLASGKVSAMPPGPDRDAAIKGLFKPAFEVEPDSALIWAASISNASERSSQVTSGFRDWYRDDPTAAEDWLKRTRLDEGLRQSLSGIVGKN